MSRLNKSLLALALALVFILPVRAAPPVLISESAVLIDADTGQVLYDKAMDKRQFPASITKIATVIVGIENAEMTDVLTMTDEAVFSVGRDTSHIALTPGEEITFEQAVYAALLMSANDACNGIAEHVSGDIASFVELMNESAAEYGAKNTHFSNANGLNDSDHYTTAYDMAMICRHAIKNPTFREVFGARTYEMPPNNKQPETRYFANQHEMISDPAMAYDGIIGGKTGWTTAAQHTLVTAAERDGRTLIAVVMKSPKNENKYSDTRALLDYGFSEFETVTIGNDDLDLPEGHELSESVTLLVPVGTDMSSVRASLSMENGSDYIELTLDAADGESTSLGKVPCTVAIDASKSEKPAAAQEEGRSGLTPLGVLGLILLAIVLLFAAFVLSVIIRKKIYRMRRRRRRYR